MTLIDSIKSFGTCAHEGHWSSFVINSCEIFILVLFWLHENRLGNLSLFYVLKVVLYHTNISSLTSNRIHTLNHLDLEFTQILKLAGRHPHHCQLCLQICVISFHSSCRFVFCLKGLVEKIHRVITPVPCCFSALLCSL